MKTTTVILGSAVLAGTSWAHSAIMPPMPDRWLTPNSTTAPEGCKLLMSDKGFPSDEEFRSTFPGIFKKLKGTVGPDWMLQARTVADVQKAVNFAREKNIRTTLISTGHDFHGRGTGRSGLRIDLAAMQEPTVFTNDWKCGDNLKPMTHHGRSINFEDIHTCRVAKNKRTAISGRAHEFHYFEKREGWTCDMHMNKKRQEQKGGMEGMSMGGGGLPGGVPTHNIIKPVPGKQAYARVSGGMFNEMFYKQAADSGLMTLGAQHGGVSVTGGWMQAGGHNPFAHKFGMQVDNVVEIEVVTADGKFQKVSECNNPELFWALRGGGGGTFGVVTGITVKVFPTFPITVTRFFVNSTSKEGILDATGWFLQNGAKLRDEGGLQGYFYVYPNSFQSVLHMPDQFSKMENAKNITEFTMKKLEEIAGSKSRITPKYYEYKTYKDWYVAEMGDEEGEEKGELFLSYFDGSDGSAPSAEEMMHNPLRVLPWAAEFPQYPEKAKRALNHAEASEYVASFEGMEGQEGAQMETAVMRSQPNPRHYLDSRLLSDKHVNSVSIKTLTKAMNESMPDIPGIHWRGFLYGGGEMAKKDPESTGLVPAWRDVTWHFIINSIPGVVRHDYNVLPLAKLFPDAAGYINEASHEEPNWKQAFFGSHYDKLLAIKKKVDPQNVFWCSPCVGADMFTYDDERICKAKESSGSPPQTFPNAKSKVGIASLPGGLGIPHPLIPLITDWVMEKKLPKTMLRSSYFKIAMGEGGSAGGKFKDNDPYKPGQKLAVIQR